jgi:hypothetical protein
MSAWQIVTTAGQSTRVEATDYSFEDGLVHFSASGEAALVIPASHLSYAKRLKDTDDEPTES